ncbi:MAG: glycosyltransferase family 4 protein [Pseudomonadales bacterium]|nr:glycosyltransferase family 4 protein [Pseudomonadales bacterium]
MKILQVLPGLESGGVEKGTLEIASAAVSAGYQSFVLSAGGRMVQPLEQQGSTHICWDIGKKSLLTLFEVRKIRKWLQAEKFDVVHVRSRMPAWIIWMAWNKMDPQTRPKLISTVHGMHSVSKYSAIMTCGEQVIAVSESIEQYILDNYPNCSADKINLIYRGIEAEKFPAEYQASATWINGWYAQFPQTKNKLVLTLPGRLTRLKGHLAFLEMFAELQQQNTEVIALIVGDEDPKRVQYAKELRERVEHLALSEQVIFTGHRSDMREIYSISNIVFSLSSKPESFGRTVLEALSMGTPVVGYDHGGVSEILRMLFPEGAVAVNNKNKLLEITARILKKEHDKIIPNDSFLLSNMQTQTLALYRKVTQLKGAA